jgi:hypothetical protein
MKIEVKDGATRADGREPLGCRDAVQSSVKVCEKPRVAEEQPRSAREIHAHRGSGRALEDEIRAVDANYLWCGIAPLAHVPHHVELARRDVTPAVTTQDGTRIERVHVRITTACEKL